MLQLKEKVSAKKKNKNDITFLENDGYYNISKYPTVVLDWMD